ncbi:hypothetical protein ADL00_04655 [Streptomyces sp. AS58]|uniref:hypothetical protein n=1 Tax=Streptomyces sp. AS58 TaxID=1519489 RepID=UPI0006B027ED|nr:hypothetical protein [Streptomyces sp. AS58]KOV73249.1 hypothetical protein ADL00_04655 [Streptomyces sp. AS58]
MASSPAPALQDGAAPSVLDEYRPCLDDRWNGGCTNAWKLCKEIVPLGYKGSYQYARWCLSVRQARLTAAGDGPTALAPVAVTV